MKINLKEKVTVNNRVIDARKAAELLGISRSTVYKMVARKEIAYIEYPYAIRFYEDDIYDFLQKHRITPERRKKDPL